MFDPQQVQVLAARRLTEQQIADVLDIELEEMRRDTKMIASFRTAIRKGRAKGEAELRAALYKRAKNGDAQAYAELIRREKDSN